MCRPRAAAAVATTVGRPAHTPRGDADDRPGGTAELPGHRVDVRGGRRGERGCGHLDPVMAGATICPGRASVSPAVSTDDSTVLTQSTRVVWIFALIG